MRRRILRGAAILLTGYYFWQLMPNGNMYLQPPPPNGYVNGADCNADLKTLQGAVPSPSPSATPISEFYGPCTVHN